jgi:hypothetical protein
VGISEVEFLGPDDEAEPEPDAEADAASARSDAAESGPESVGSEPPRRFRLPGLGGRADAWVTPVTLLLAVLILVVAGGVYAVVRHKDRVSDGFDVVLISAQYTMRQDASGINLTMAVQNTGSTMVELTGVSVLQPGLIRFSQSEAAPDVTAFDAGSQQQSAFGPGTAITPIALAPKDVEMVIVPFRYDCANKALPPVNRNVGLTGFTAQGNSRSTQLVLPPDATPWQSGGLMRSDLCNQPSAQADLEIAYDGYGNTLMALTPVRFNYTITLTAPAATSVTVSSISQDNPGISATTDPAVPITVLDGQSVRLTVTWRVMSCVIATSVHLADGIEITATANQSVQTWHAKLGPQFTKDLDAEISTVCSGG